MKRVCITEIQASLYTLSLLSPLAPPLVTLLGDRELDTLALGQRHLGLGTFTNDENVGKPIISSQPLPNKHIYATHLVAKVLSNTSLT